MTGAQFGGVDIDLLADYIGGALAGTPDEPVVAALVADDPAWRAAYVSLSGGMERVGVALGGFGPEPMPVELAARLDEMFRAPDDQVPLPAGTTPVTASDATPVPAPLDTPPAGAHSGAADPTPVPAELAAPPVPRLAPVRGTHDGPADDASGSQNGRRDATGPDDRRRPADTRPAGSPVRRTGRRMRWATPIALAAGLFAFVGFSLDYLAGVGAENATDSSAGAPAAGTAEAGAGDADAGAAARAAPADEQILSTGTDYTLATLAIEPPPRPFAAPEINASDSVKGSQSRASADRAALGRLVDRTALDACLAAIEQANAGGPLSVSSVDYARFDGKPAVVVRFSAANGQWAWASGEQCGLPDGGADTLGKVPVR